MNGFATFAHELSRLWRGERAELRARFSVNGLGAALTGKEIADI
jgi:hypothetical protein